MIGEKQYYVYILASAKHGTLYVGVTGDLLKRIWEHREEIAEGFTKNMVFTNSFGMRFIKK